MKIEGLHNQTGKWVALIADIQGQDVDILFKKFLAGNSRKGWEEWKGICVDRTHFSAFRLVE